MKYERKLFNKYAYTIEVCEVDQVVGQRLDQEVSVGAGCGAQRQTRKGSTQPTQELHTQTNKHNHNSRRMGGNGSSNRQHHLVDCKP